MTPSTSKPPIFFLSYARSDTKFPQFQAKMREFIGELSARVAERMALQADDVCFFDESDIEAGTLWTVQLAEALRTCRVGVPVYSNYYFNSPWCGREFQVLLNRRPNATPQDPAATGIFPVLWIKRIANLPAPATEIQYKDAAFPPEYEEIGIRQLLTLRSTYTVQYENAMAAMADRIVEAATKSPLSSLATLDLENTPSAWETANRANAQSHTEGGITKTCFVYISRDGWAWQPYPETKRPIGALAQQLAGELAIQYQQLEPDERLVDKLKDTRNHKVPTVLFVDPVSLQDEAYAAPARLYDDLYLRNCGALLPWTPESRANGNDDQSWRYIREHIFQQKTLEALPNHEWRSIFSQEDLLQKARVVIENLRARLRNDILTDAPSATEMNPAQGTGEPQPATHGVLKAEDANVVDAAARQGIKLDTAPQMEGPTR